LIWLLIAAGFGVLEGVILYDAEHEEGQSKKGAEHNHEGAPSALSTPEEDNARQEKHRAAERAHWAHERFHNKIVTGFSAAAAGAAIVAAIIAGWAYIQTKRQADAAEEQTRVARNAAIVANRAIVLSNTVQFITYGAKVDDPDGKGNVNPRWIVTPVIENIGNTPTRNMRYSSDFAMGGGMTAETFERQSPYSESFSPASIGPKGSITTVEFRAGPNLLIQIQQRNAFLGADGVIKYQDIFGGHHLTEFCYTAQVPPIDFKNYPVGQAIRTQSILCERHNCADDECGPDWEERAKQ
jgi:hypothetical protein